jgi:hypothetical protein
MNDAFLENLRMVKTRLSHAVFAEIAAVRHPIRIDDEGDAFPPPLARLLDGHAPALAASENLDRA